MFEICALKVKSAGAPVKNPPNPAIPPEDLGTIDESGMKIRHRRLGAPKVPKKNKAMQVRLQTDIECQSEPGPPCPPLSHLKCGHRQQSGHVRRARA
jgi:hypothetical protein